MNARLDLLAPASTEVVPLSTALLCCARYVAGRDTPPPLVASAASLLESGGSRLVAVLRKALQGAAASRQ